MDKILKKLIGESTTCEFKEYLERKQIKSWLKSVSAFANGIGGSFIQDRDLDEVYSKRRNPILADVFAQLNYMEKRGSGLRKICKETAMLPGFSESKGPRFRSQATSFYTELLNNNYLRMKNEPANDSANDSVNDSVKLTLIQQDLVTLLKQNPHFTGLELAEHLHVSIASVWRVLSQLKELNLIERKGSDKNGHWIVK
jgi:ATP-dependent DNA helicase RecG